MLDYIGFFITAVGEIVRSNIGLFCIGTLAILSIKPVPREEKFY